MRVKGSGEVLKGGGRVWCLGSGGTEAVVAMMTGCTLHTHIWEWATLYVSRTGLIVKLERCEKVTGKIKKLQIPGSKSNSSISSSFLFTLSNTQQEKKIKTVQWSSI